MATVRFILGTKRNGRKYYLYEYSYEGIKVFDQVYKWTSNKDNACKLEGSESKLDELLHDPNMLHRHPNIFAVVDR